MWSIELKRFNSSIVPKERKHWSDSLIYCSKTITSGGNLQLKILVIISQTSTVLLKSLIALTCSVNESARRLPIALSTFAPEANFCHWSKLLPENPFHCSWNQKQRRSRRKGRFHFGPIVQRSAKQNWSLYFLFYFVESQVLDYVKITPLNFNTSHRSSLCGEYQKTRWPFRRHRWIMHHDL